MLYPSAKVVIKHPEDASKILLVKRTVGNSYFYEPAGGKVEVDFVKNCSETLEQCAIRETQEELGLSINLERYLGSYYFFWKIDPLKYSSCAVFLAAIRGDYNTFSKNTDSCELPIEPVWIAIEDIKSGKVPIDESYRGLKEILLAL